MNRDQIAAIVRGAEARATRAEAHAERLAGALEAIKSACEATSEHPYSALDGIDTTARQALSDYNQRTET